MLRVLTAGVVCLGLLAPTVAAAWGATGHRLIGVAAVRALPDELPAFLRTEAAATEIGELSREPDRWKDAGRVHDDDRDPAHFIDLDDAGRALGGPTLQALPDTLLLYRTAVRAAGSDENEAGWLPYAIIDAWQQLRLDFAYWRVLAAAERRATDPGRRAWFAEDRRRREALILRDMGELSHYVGDGGQPLHLSIHHNGWAPDAANPEGFTTARTTHGAFEGAFVRANIDQAALDVALRPAAETLPIERRVPRYLGETWRQVTPFYRLERAGGLTTDVAAGHDFALGRLAAGASELRDLTVDAWRASGDAEVGWRPVRVRDVEAGTVDPYESLRGVD